MPVEDIDFLKKNSVKQNYLFLVDSKDRNKLAYPEASEYVVDFSVPFKNVIGLNLVDASIPRTMYNVDVYNNEIKFFIHSSNYDLNTLNLNSFQTTILEPGDYTIQTLTVELNSKLKMYLNSNINLPYTGITAAAITNPPDIKNRLQFICPYPFIFNMKDSTMSETLGFDGYVRKSENLKAIFDRNYEVFLLDSYNGITDTTIINTYKEVQKNLTLDTIIAWLEAPPYNLNHIAATLLATRVYQYGNNYQLFHSVDIDFPTLQTNPTELAANTYTIFEGPKGVIRTISLGDYKIAQRFYVPYKTNLVKIYAALQTAEVSVGSIATFTIQKDNEGIPDGIPVETGSIAVSFIDGSYSDSTDLSYTFETNAYYWVVFDTGVNINIYYNDVLISNTSLQVYDNDTWVKLDDLENEIYYQLSLRIDVCDDYHKIKGPGIYSLVGERYIILRCKEIEENSYRSLAYTSHTLGVAKFRLGVVGYREERLDYSSVPNREFHPIGKLSRLTMRFETSSGKLYDFKDVNHTLTFGIQYLEPVGKVEFTKSIINSNYNGDFMKYQYSQQQQEEDSDDQDIDYNRDEFEKYKQNEARNLPWQVAQRNVQMFYDLNYPEEEEDVEL